MKTTNIQKILSIVFFIFIFFSVKAIEHPPLNQASGNFSVSGQDYVDNMEEVWYVNIGVNKPIKFNFSVDIEGGCDYVEIFSIDNNGNVSEFPDKSYTGYQVGQMITGVASGRAMVVFYSDGSVSNDDGYDGIHFSFSESNDMVLIDNLYVNGNLGVGTTNPIAKLDVVGKLHVSDDLYGYRVLTFQDDARFFVTTANIPNLTCSPFSMPKYGVAAPNAGTAADFWISGYNAIRMFTYGNPTPALSILNNSNVGIGTITPNAKLEVFNTAQSGHLILSTNDNSSADLSRIDLDYKIANNNQTIARISSGYPNSANGGSGILRFYTSNSGVLSEKMRINANGNVSIGTTNIDPTGAMLTVKGLIHTREVNVDLNAPLADYVFSPAYSLMPLNQVEQFVKTNNHLPDIPSASEVSKNGLNMGEMQNKLLQKVEELTLYVIEQNKKIEELQKKVK